MVMPLQVSHKNTVEKNTPNIKCVLTKKILVVLGVIKPAIKWYIFFNTPKID